MASNIKNATITVLPDMISLDAKEMIPEIILASASPRRSDILKKYGIKFVQQSSGAEEPGSFFAQDAAMNNARRKALDISRQNPDKIVLSADTVIGILSILFPHSFSP